MNAQAIFEIPDVFVDAYRSALMEWAVAGTPTRRVALLRMPGVERIGFDLVDEVELAAAKFRHPVSGEHRVVVSGASAFDVEVIEWHCARLPVIKAARRAFARRCREEMVRNGGRRYFCEGMPREFAEHYRDAFENWMRTSRWRGGRCAVPFDVPGGVRGRDAEGREIWAGAWFDGEWDESVYGPRFVIRPASEAERDLVERHTAAMRGWRQ
jgi:hypothetical protein